MSNPYEPPNEANEPESEPVEPPKEMMRHSSKLSGNGMRSAIFAVLVLNWFCQAVTTRALFAYIEKCGGPTSKAIDSAFYGYPPIVIATASTLAALAMLIAFGRRN